MKEITFKTYQQRLLAVMVYIQHHLDDEITLEQLASIAALSPYHFHRVFKGMVCESVKEHIRRLRLERAATRLKQSDESIIQIALAAGYGSHEAFTRAFKSLCGMNPSSYRAARGPAKPPSTANRAHYRSDGSVDGIAFALRDDSLEVTIRHVPKTKVAFVRHVGPYSDCGQAWDRLLPRLGKDGWLGADTQFYGLCYDDPEVTKPENLRYDACVTIGESFTPESEIGVQCIAGGYYAVTTHEGPYERLGETYARLYGRWLPYSGRELKAAPCLEVYLNDPHGTEPEDLLTDIYAPLESRP